jgi:hypothetical protein
VSCEPVTVITLCHRRRQQRAELAPQKEGQKAALTKNKNQRDTTPAEKMKNGNAFIQKYQRMKFPKSEKLGQKFIQFQKIKNKPVCPGTIFFLRDESPTMLYIFIFSLYFSYSLM